MSDLSKDTVLKGMELHARGIYILADESLANDIATKVLNWIKFIKSQDAQLQASQARIKELEQGQEEKLSFASAFFECYDELRDIVAMQHGNPHIRNAEKIINNLATMFDKAYLLLD